jgi:hypothetical protein
VTIIFILLIYFLIFGKEGFKSESTFDLNTHDTYLVISNIHFIFTLSILLFFGVYLVRSLNTKFKNLIVNIILMISTILLIITLMNIFPFIEIINEKKSGWTINPPLSVNDLKIEKKIEKNNIRILSYIIFIFQLLLVMFLVYLVFITRRNFRKTL